MENTEENTSPKVEVLDAEESVETENQTVSFDAVEEKIKEMNSKYRANRDKARNLSEDSSMKINQLEKSHKELYLNAERVMRACNVQGSGKKSMSQKLLGIFGKTGDKLSMKVEDKVYEILHLTKLLTK